MTAQALQDIKGIATKRTHAHKGDRLKVIATHGEVYILEHPNGERFPVHKTQVQILEN
ncbi:MULTISPECIES: hypothetical protein [Capnocytophaga]|uniref:hypothetical protein n=1 Tax=Capnocytophaga TaxID=1016 RepID=UPI0012FF63C0|nr:MULTISPECIES: hypothetical protein [Capnocytophaga]GIM61297.1 hypothetical protein CAPN008_13470 [Capnocytophaga canis]